MKRREWTFRDSRGEDAFLLVHEKEAVGIIAKADDLDWEAYSNSVDDAGAKPESHPA